MTHLPFTDDCEDHLLFFVLLLLLASLLGTPAGPAPLSLDLVVSGIEFPILTLDKVRRRLIHGNIVNAYLNSNVGYDGQLPHRRRRRTVQHTTTTAEQSRLTCAEGRFPGGGACGGYRQHKTARIGRYHCCVLCLPHSKNDAQLITLSVSLAVARPFSARSPPSTVVGSTANTAAAAGESPSIMPVGAAAAAQSPMQWRF